MLTKADRKAHRRAFEAIFKTRRENLRKLCNVLTDGNWGELGRVYGISPSFLCQLAGPNPVRTIGERAARNLEIALGVDTGSLDE